MKKGKLAIAIVFGDVRVGMERKSGRSRREMTSGLVVAVRYVCTSYIICNMTCGRRAHVRRVYS